MPEEFDPDAWPNPGGTTRPSANKKDDLVPQRIEDDDDDDYDPFGFGATPPAVEQQQAGTSRDRVPAQIEEHDPFGYDDFDAVDKPSTGEQDDDYEYDDDEYDDELASPNGHGKRGAGNAQFDDEYDTYDDLYDREPGRQGSNTTKTLAAVAIGLVIVLAGVLGVTKLVLGDSDKKAATDATQPGTGTSEPAPQEVMVAVDNALVAWGKFAVSGDLNEVKPYFVNDGPQSFQFNVDSEAIRDNPPGGAPIKFTLDPQTLKSYKVSENDWLLKADVVQTRTGEKTLKYSWEMRVIRQSESDLWRVLSVRQFSS